MTEQSQGQRVLRLYNAYCRGVENIPQKAIEWDRLCIAEKSAWDATGSVLSGIDLATRETTAAPLLAQLAELRQQLDQRTMDSLEADSRALKLSDTCGLLRLDLASRDKRIAELEAEVERRTNCGCGTELTLVCSDIGCDRHKVHQL